MSVTQCRPVSASRFGPNMVRTYALPLRRLACERNSACSSRPCHDHEADVLRQRQADAADRGDLHIPVVLVSPVGVHLGERANGLVFGSSVSAVEVGGCRDDSADVIGQCRGIAGVVPDGCSAVPTQVCRGVRPGACPDPDVVTWVQAESDGEFEAGPAAPSRSLSRNRCRSTIVTSECP
jgi:hypothetical protein